MSREIEFEIPYHIRAPDGFESSNAQFYPRVAGFPIQLSFQTRTDGQIDVGGLATVRRDRFGNVVRSGVRAKFHPQFEKVVPDDLPGKGMHPAGTWLKDRNGFYIKAAIQALNKFIDIYREETGSYWIRRIEPGDVGSYEIRDLSNGDLVNSTERTVTPGSVQIGGMTEEDLQEIESRLESESKPNVYQTLHLDAKERIDQGEYSVGVILSYELFERWLKSSFVIASATGSQSKSEAEDIIKTGDGKYADLSNILQNMLEDHTGVDFQNSDVFNKWDELLRKERNRVVHDDYEANKESSENSHRTAIETIEWFQDKWSESLAGTAEDVSFVNIEDTSK